MRNCLQAFLSIWGNPGATGNFFSLTPHDLARRMLRIACSFLTLVASLWIGNFSAFAATEESDQWIRYPAISPDGNWIAFSFHADIWIVSAEGGAARRLTSHAGHEKDPVWAPDSQSIAFASDRHGNWDVFIMPAQGGEPMRLTHHSDEDRPVSFSVDGTEVFFTGSQQDAHDSHVPHSSLDELYSVPITGGRAKQILTTPAGRAKPSPDGKYLVYEDYKGYENYFRKHHQSAVTRDVWLYDFEKKEHTKLTSFRGEDREPIWSTDGKRILFLSERNGSFNVYSMKWKPILKSGDEDDGKIEQLTHHTPHAVRSLSIANDGTLCYGYLGSVYVKSPNKEPRAIEIDVRSDPKENLVSIETLREGATEMTVSPNGKEVALIVRGELFVANTEFGTTKRITSTPSQERSVVWGNDNRTLYYAGEREGAWNLYKATIANKDEASFSVATIVKEEVVLANGDENFQPVLSPNGKMVAFLRNRDELQLLNLKTKETKSIVPPARNYSYTDGDINFSFSPDNKWLAFTYCGHKRWLNDIGIVNLDTLEIHNVTESGYDEGAPVWSRDSRALLFVSDRYGRRNHGSWGSDQDILAIYLNDEAFQWSKMTEEEHKRWKEEEDEKKEADEEKDTKSKKAKKKAAKDKTKAIDVQTTDFKYRTSRLTIHSAPIGEYAITKDGETLVYFAQVDGKWDLWKTKLRTKATSKLLAIASEESGTLQFGDDDETLIVMTDKGELKKVTIPEDGEATEKGIDYGAEMAINAPEEREYMFEHVWRQVKRKFYRADLHGVDWDSLKVTYAKLLPSVSNNFDFAELLSEMLGELNASHTGAMSKVGGEEGADATAALGLIFDLSHEGDGLKVVEVLKRGPADQPKSKIRPGVIIEKIDSIQLTPEVDPWQQLNRKATKSVRLSLIDPANDKKWEEVIKPISLAAQTELLYQRWIDSRRALVEKLSEGRVGYVHVRDMDDDSFRKVYMETLGLNSDKEALLVDTRFNGGGWLHDDLISFLSAKDYVYVVPRDKERGTFGGEPTFRWTRPVAVLQSESNYSDAHFFPYSFKAVGAGPLIGTPVAGTATAVWWEELIDSSIVFGIPQVGVVTLDGEYLENNELKPDYEVYLTPNDMANGLDPQIEKSVEVLLKQIEENAKH